MFVRCWIICACITTSGLMDCPSYGDYVHSFLKIAWINLALTRSAASCCIAYGCSTLICNDALMMLFRNLQCPDMMGTHMKWPQHAMMCSYFSFCFLIKYYERPTKSRKNNLQKIEFTRGWWFKTVYTGAFHLIAVCLSLQQPTSFSSKTGPENVFAQLGCKGSSQCPPSKRTNWWSSFGRPGLNWDLVIRARPTKDPAELFYVGKVRNRADFDIQQPSHAFAWHACLFEQESSFTNSLLWCYMFSDQQENAPSSRTCTSEETQTWVFVNLFWRVPCAGKGTHTWIETRTWTISPIGSMYLTLGVSPHFPTTTRAYSCWLHNLKIDFKSWVTKIEVTEFLETLQISWNLKHNSDAALIKGPWKSMARR